MAFDNLDEHEQGELVRKWIRDNAASILVGIVLGLLLIFGWRQWASHRLQRDAQAAIEYQAFDKAMTAKNEPASKEGLERLKKDFGDSAYAVLASLRAAEAASAKKDLAGAETLLAWAYEHASGDAMKSLAGQQLARVRIAAGKAADALTLVNALPVAGYAASIAELRGDALAAQGKRDEARAAYEASLQALDPQSPGRQLLEWKRDDQSGAAPVAAPAVAPAAEKQSS
jgi:predicted negative regulator of RcsB-dependent stress response